MIAGKLTINELTWLEDSPSPQFSETQFLSTDIVNVNSKWGKGHYEMLPGSPHAVPF